MTQLAKYHGRAPRYVLNTEDNNLIRYSGSERWSWEEKTEIRNVSLTGLSFIAPSDLSPLLGEIIKIQFVIPGSKQMACYAIVIRIDKDGDFENLIAVHFYKLDRLQRINLLQGLSQKNSGTDATVTRQGQISSTSKFIAILGLILTAVCWATLMKIYFSR